LVNRKNLTLNLSPDKKRQENINTFNHNSFTLRKEKQMKQKLVPVVVCALLVFGIIACSGGGGGGSSSDSTPDGNPAGIWTGSFTENGDTYDVSGLLYNGEIMAFSTEGGVLYKGSYTVNGNSITAQMNCYQIGGGFFATSRLSGTFSEENQFDGTFTTTYIGNGTTNGSLSLIFDEAYNRPSSFGAIAGNWTIEDGLYTANAQISDQGQFTATDTDGCVYNGVISILDPEHNVYGLDVDVTVCAIAGQFDGYAILHDTNIENDTLIIGAESEDYIIFGEALRETEPQ
jgi:hypothetical protein